MNESEQNCTPYSADDEDPMYLAVFHLMGSLSFIIVEKVSFIVSFN